MEHGVIPGKLLEEFCHEQGSMFLAALRLMNQFGTLSLEEGAQSTVKWVNLLQVLCGASNRNAERRPTFKDCPLVWDTGALFGLTPFCGDFVDYIECKITVQDIACENTVVGIGTTLHRLKINGA